MYTMMAKIYVNLQIEKPTFKKFKQAKKLREFQLEKDITNTEFLEDMLEKEFKKSDGKVIKKTI